jgi:hypothetical protein
MACALFKLRQDAYTKIGKSVSRDVWTKERTAAIAQFKLWELILNTELTILTWDRAIHECDFFPLYIEALSAVQLMFPALDLLVKDPRVLADSTVVASIKTRCETFFQDRLIARTTQIHDTITKAKRPLCQACASREITRSS